MPPAFSGNTRRLCGAAGCTFPDFHMGPCSFEMELEKRPRCQAPSPSVAKPPPPEPKQAPKQARKPKVVEVAPEEPPPEQRMMPSGLHRFYHTHRWGVPLPMGSVEAGTCDEELDQSWRLRESGPGSSGSISPSRPVCGRENYGWECSAVS